MKMLERDLMIIISDLIQDTNDADINNLSKRCYQEVCRHYPPSDEINILAKEIIEYSVMICDFYDKHCRTLDKTLERIIALIKKKFYHLEDRDLSHLEKIDSMINRKDLKDLNIGLSKLCSFKRLISQNKDVGLVSGRMSLDYYDGPINNGPRRGKRRLPTDHYSRKDMQDDLRNIEIEDHIGHSKVAKSCTNIHNCLCDIRDDLQNFHQYEMNTILENLMKSFKSTNVNPDKISYFHAVLENFLSNFNIKKAVQLINTLKRMSADRSLNA